MYAIYICRHLAFVSLLLAQLHIPDLVGAPTTTQTTRARVDTALSITRPNLLALTSASAHRVNSWPLSAAAESGTEHEPEPEYVPEYGESSWFEFTSEPELEGTSDYELEGTNNDLVESTSNVLSSTNTQPQQQPQELVSVSTEQYTSRFTLTRSSNAQSPHVSEAATTLSLSSVGTSTGERSATSLISPSDTTDLTTTTSVVVITPSTTTMVPEATIATARPTEASASEARPDEPSVPTARPAMETTRCECPSTGFGSSSSSGTMYSQEMTSEETQSKAIASTPPTLTPSKANFINPNAWETGGCLLHSPVRGVPCDLSLATGAALVTLALVVIVQALILFVRHVSRKRAGRKRAPVAVAVARPNSLEMLPERQTSRTSTRLSALWDRSATIRRVLLGQSQATHKVSEL